MKMATAMYLEHYLDSIENLPCELQRNFQLMRELDQRTEDKKAEIDMLAAEYISTVKALSPGQRVEQLRKIQDAYSRCREYSDDKVQLAMQTYEMVDKHIRRLDADLARFEADLKDKLEGSDCEGSGGRGLKKGRGQKEKRGSRGRGRRTSEEDTPKKKKHKGGSEFSDTILSVHPSDVLDMPVDPNEPTYCLCHQVSYGEMIGCDNPDCPIEWFHFACVDLTTKPKGKWSVWGVGLSRPAGVVCTGSPEDRRVDLPSCSLGPSGCGCGGLACDAAWSCFPGSDWQRDICPPLHGSRCLLCLCNTFLLLS
ncbi:inhibitor of growth protein 5 isoform X2 [Manis pentadactyla]|uniref:inhibitor of growth protein 5 isoform X2 n=1 Tax=Manis pentadactyla TaxID=143292 RepID=UPI00255CDB54|nr:inhibitor of growth protein 5 isoform X2 [Manis pentadactyla]